MRGRGDEREMTTNLSQTLSSWLKTERVARKVHRTRDQARADVLDYIERFYNTTRKPSTFGYPSPTVFEQKAELA